MRQNKFPPGWNPERVKRVLANYESQSEEEAVAEDEQHLKRWGKRSCKIGTVLAFVLLFSKTLSQAEKQKTIFHNNAPTGFH